MKLSFTACKTSEVMSQWLLQKEWTCPMCPFYTISQCFFVVIIRDRVREIEQLVRSSLTRREMSEKWRERSGFFPLFMRWGDVKQHSLTGERVRLRHASCSFFLCGFKALKRLLFFHSTRLNASSRAQRPSSPLIIKPRRSIQDISNILKYDYLPRKWSRCMWRVMIEGKIDRVTRKFME